MPWSRGPVKNSGKMVIRSNRTLAACVQVAKAFWQRNINAPRGDNRRVSLEVKNPMFRVIAVHPEILQTDGSWFALGLAQENLQAGGKSRGKIGEQLGQNFALVAARTNDARNQHPALLFNGGIQSSSISSVKRLCSFIPAAPRSVRIALAVRPWRPMTFPRSSGWTRNSRTVTCDPSTAFTRTPSG